MRGIRGTAVFCGGLAAQVVVLLLFFTVPDNRLSYPWYNAIGCLVCICVSAVTQPFLKSGPTPQPA
jgi:hypothetical protein